MNAFKDSKLTNTLMSQPNCLHLLKMFVQKCRKEHQCVVISNKLISIW